MKKVARPLCTRLLLQSSVDCNASLCETLSTVNLAPKPSFRTFVLPSHVLATHCHTAATPLTHTAHQCRQYQFPVYFSESFCCCLCCIPQAAAAQQQQQQQRVASMHALMVSECRIMWKGHWLRSAAVCGRVDERSFLIAPQNCDSVPNSTRGAICFALRFVQPCPRSTYS